MRKALRKLLRATLVVLLALVVLALGAWVLREPLFGARVKREITDALSAALGGRYAVEDLEGNWITGIRVVGITTVEPPSSGALERFDVDEAFVGYDLVTLLGDDSLAGVERIRLSGVEVDLDPGRPAGRAGDGPGLDLPSSLSPAVAIEGTLRIAGSSGAATLGGLRLAVGPGVPLSVDVDEVSLPEPFEVRGPLAGRVERIDAHTLEWTSDAILGGVRFPWATYAEGGAVAARVEIASGTVDVTVRGGAVVASIDELDLARLPAWLRDRLPEGVLSSGAVSGRVTSTIAKLPAFSFDLGGTDLGVRDLTFARVVGKGRWNGRRGITLARFEAESADARAFVEGATLDLDLPWLVPSADLLVLDVEDLSVLVPEIPRPVHLAIRARSAGPERFQIEHAVVASGADVIEGRGTLVLPADPSRWRETEVEGTFEGSVSDLAPLAVDLTGRVGVSGSVRGAVTRPIVELGLTGTDARIEGYALRRASLAGRVVPGGVEAFRLDVVGASGEIRGEGTARLAPFVLVLEEAVVRVDDVERLARRLAPDLPPLAGSLDGAGRIRIEAGTIEVAGRVEARRLVVDGRAVGALDARVRTEGETIRLDALGASGPWGRAEVTGTVRPRARSAAIEGLRVDADGEISFLRAPLEVEWSDDGQISFGVLDAEVTGVHVRAEGAVSPDRGEVVLSRLDVRKDDLRVEASHPLEVTWRDGVVEVGEARLRVNGDTDVLAALRADTKRETVVIAALDASGPWGVLRLDEPLRLSVHAGTVVFDGLDLTCCEGARVMGSGSVRLDDRTARLDELHVAREDLDAQLRRPATLSWDADGVALTDLDADVLGAAVRGRAAWRDGPEADLEFDGFDLARFIESPTGTLRGWVRLGDGAVTAQAGAEDLALGPWRGRVEAIVRQDAEGPIRVERLRLNGPDGGTLDGSAVLPWRVSHDGFAVLDDVVPTFELEGVTGGLGLFTEAADGPIRVVAKGRDGAIEAEIRVADLGLCQEGSLCDDGVFHLRIARESGRIDITLASDELAETHGQVTIQPGLDWTRPESIGVFLDEAQIDGRLRAVVRSWGPLAEAAPDLQRLEGAAAVDVVVRGPLRAPVVEGALTLQNFSVELETDVAPFEEVNAHIVWSGDEIRIEKFEGLMGYAPFSLQGVIQGPLSGAPEFDLTLNGENTQLLRTDWTRMRIDVDARITGPIDGLLVKGGGRIVDATFRAPISLSDAGETGESSEVVLFEILDWPFSEMRFDLDLVADNSVRFRNNLFRANLSFEGSLRGTGRRPEPVGRAWFSDADVLLPLTTLRHGEGEIRFLPDIPFRPRVQFTADTRTKGYEMGVQIAGTIPDVNLYVFTEPRLDDEDAILMLTTGSTGAELADGGILGKALSGALSMFGGSLFSARGDEGEPGRVAFFERFQFTTDWEGTDITRIDGEIELTERFYLHLGTDRFEASNLGLIWRLRFR